MAAGSNKVEIELTATDRDVVNALQKLHAKLDVTETKLKKIADTSKGAQSAVSGVFEKGTQALGSFVQGIAGIGTVVAGVKAAIEALNREVERMRQRQDAAKLAQLDAAGATRLARIAFSEDATMKDADLETSIRAGAAKTGATFGVVAAVDQSTFSAKGNLFNTMAVAARNEGLLMTPDDFGAAAAFGGRILDRANAGAAAEIADPEKRARAIGGSIQMLQASSRAKSLEAVGKQLVPAGISLKMMGDTFEEADELVATINTGLADEEGSISKTAAISLGQQLLRFVPKTKGKNERGEKVSVPAGEIAGFEAAAGPSARLKFLQENKAIQAAFLGQASFGAESDAFSRALIRGEAGPVDLWKRNQAAIGGFDEAAALQEAKLAAIREGRFEATAANKRAADSTTEAMKLASPIEGRIASVREGLAEKFKAIETFADDWTAFPENLIGGSFFGMEQSNAFDALLSEGFGPERAGAAILRHQAQNIDTEKERQAFVSYADELERNAATVETKERRLGIAPERAPRALTSTLSGESLDVLKQVRDILQRQTNDRPQVPTARPAAQHGRNND